MAGVDSLDYIAHHTFEQWQKDSRELFEELEDFELIPEEFVANKWLIARDVQKDIRAIYMPYYDIKMLEFFHKFHEDISIVTYEDMAETISHCLRREVPIYNVEGELLEVNQYQLSGRLVGNTSINNEKKRKKTLKHIGVNVSAEEKKMIEKMTKANGTSISYYIRKLIRMHLNEDYDQYLKSQQLERNNRKK
jgi:predicted DNA-binding protein